MATKGARREVVFWQQTTNQRSALSIREAGHFLIVSPTRQREGPRAGVSSNQDASGK
jgi:hypothetical protein